ncbi:MAG: class C sortase [Lachnospiraceae bacterium]|jgi:sortase A|nr:class C sortase [Lachnospiraceae bacterium]
MKDKNKKGLMLNVIVILLVLAGFSLLLYPFVKFWTANRKTTYAIEEYDKTYEKMNKEKIEKEWEKAKIYNKNLKTGTIADPFTVNPTTVLDDYYKVLDIGENGMMGYIRIPKINLRLPIYHGTSESVLDKGIGHLKGTHLPVGGASTHSVLSGHAGLRSAVLFTNLTELKEGDEFYINILDKTLAYRIDKISVVLPDDMSGIKPIPGRDLVTLVTCTPYGINSHRLLVRGTRVKYTPEGLKKKIADTKVEINWMTKVLIGAAICFALIILYLLYRFIKKIKKKRVKDNSEKN